MVSYAVRFPELMAKSKSIGGEIDMDPAVCLILLWNGCVANFLVMQTVEHDRQRLLAVERLALETICFNFTSRMAFPYVIKLGRTFKGILSSLRR
jgi:CTD kinase subunit beta